MKKALTINTFNIWHEEEIKEEIEKLFETDYIEYDNSQEQIFEPVLEQLTKKDYDLIITPAGFSWQKEDMRGFELTEKIREQYPDMKSLIFSYRSYPVIDFEYKYYLKPLLDKGKDSFYQFSDSINSKEIGKQEAYLFSKFLEQLK